MPKAEIITIGTELLLGEIQDTNTRHIALFLRNEGIDLYRSTIIGDNENRITATVKEAIERSNIVITTGGLGPTVDDPTRGAISKAMGVELIFVPELWEQIKQRFLNFGRDPTENNKKQAYIPCGSIAIENKVGTAPAFYCKTDNGILISLPGVPRELEFLLEYQVKDLLINIYKDKFVIEPFTIHTSGLGESVIDERIANFETMMNPTVGIVAYPGQVDIRITAKAKDKIQAQKMINEVLEEIKPQLGDSIFGYNDERLDKIVFDMLKENGIKLFIIEKGMNNQLNQLFSDQQLLMNETVENYETNNELIELNPEKFYNQIDPNILLITNLNIDEDEKSTLSIRYIRKEKDITKSISFGGHNKLAVTRAINTILDFLRKQLLIS